MATRRTTPKARSAGSPELVGGLLDGARSATARKAGRAVDADVWRRAVGPRIAERATPGRLSAGVLLVQVPSSVWAQELSFLEPELVQRLRGAGVDVRSLRFRVSAPGRAPAPARPRRPTPPAAPLPPELEQRLAEVDDPALRAAIAEAAGHWLAREPAGARAVTSRKPRARDPRCDAAENDPRDRAAARRRAGSKRSS